ncbi:unnamed protein product [Clonostachys chloroleuca]|uniref:Alpha/beta hydrolase fold-3 domain-containing protein n=1 Tax=Clonostachys chloroleuca TaxID=1926264 RepID=A0AA35MF79_9HYPO|nr:unnamed protein product [Clonostachys chloroleuca]
MYVHGGGFTSGSPEATSAYALQLSVELKQRGIIADIFSVGYDLAPDSPYPGGLRQIVAAFEYLTAFEKPIILMGDSAGGNLCLALLRHLHEPHPDIRAMSQNAKSAIIALCLACPWVNLRNDRQPPQLLDGVDCLDKPTLDRWRSAYMGGKPLDKYTNPIEYTGGWREILPPKALFMTGELDHFSRDIVQFVDIVRKAGHIGVDLDVAPLKGHAWNLVDFGAAKVGIPSSLIDGDVAPYNGVMIQSQWIVQHVNKA